MTSPGKDAVSVQREQLQKEYELLQKKIDTHSTFKFLVRGWSFTAIGAAALALGTKDLQFWPAMAILLGLACAALVFHVMAAEQALLVRALGHRAVRVERQLASLWPGTQGKASPIDEPSEPDVIERETRTSPALARSMKAKRYSASELVLATIVPVSAIVAMQSHRRATAKKVGGPVDGKIERHGEALGARRPRQWVRRFYAFTVLHLVWAVGKLRAPSRSLSFSKWWDARRKRLKVARDDTHLFWAQVAILGLGAMAASTLPHGKSAQQNPEGLAEHSTAKKAATTTRGAAPDPPVSKPVISQSAQDASPLDAALAPPVQQAAATDRTAPVKKRRSTISKDAGKNSRDRARPRSP